VRRGGGGDPHGEALLRQFSKQQICPTLTRDSFNRRATVQIILPNGYLEAVYEEMRAEGAACIADEVPAKPLPPRLYVTPELVNDFGP